MKSSSTGIGTILLIVFIVLKLTNTIDWSWFWVLSPLWIGIAFWALVIIIVGLISKM